MSQPAWSLGRKISTFLLVAGGSTLGVIAIAHRHVDETSRATVFQGNDQVRTKERMPGAVMSRYLGTDVPPSVWAKRIAELDPSVKECLVERGLSTDGVGLTESYTEIDELRVRDPAAFASEYAYGVAEQLRADSMHTAEGVAPPGASLPSEAEANEAAECIHARNATLDSFIAPQEIQQRYGELLQEMAGDDRYLKAAESWRQCLLAAGYAVESPFNVSNVVGRRAEALLEDATGVVVDSSNAPSLEAGALEELRAFELALYRDDQTCREQTGLTTTLFVLEDEILGTLLSEFPDYSPADQSWRSS